MGTYENPTVFTPAQQGGAQGASGINTILQMSQKLISENQKKKAKERAKLDYEAEKEGKAARARKESFESKTSGATSGGVSRNQTNADALNFDPTVTEGLNATLYNQMEYYQREANALYYANPNMSKSEQDKIQAQLVTRVNAATKGMTLLTMVNKKKDDMIKAGKTPIDNNALWDMTRDNGKHIELKFNPDNNEEYFEYTDNDGTVNIYTTNDFQELLTREQGPFNSKATLNTAPPKDDPAYPLWQFTQDKEGAYASYLNKDGTIKYGKRDELKTLMVSSGTMAGFNDPLVAASYYAGFKPPTGAFVTEEFDERFSPPFDELEWEQELTIETPTGQIENLYDEIFDFYLPPEGKKASKRKPKPLTNPEDEKLIDEALANKGKEEEKEDLSWKHDIPDWEKEWGPNGKLLNAKELEEKYKPK